MAPSPPRFRKAPRSREDLALRQTPNKALQRAPLATSADEQAWSGVSREEEERETLRGMSGMRVPDATAIFNRGRFSLPRTREGNPPTPFTTNALSNNALFDMCPHDAACHPINLAQYCI